MFKLAAIGLNTIASALLFTPICLIFDMQTRSNRIRICLTASLLFLLYKTIFIGSATAGTSDPREKYHRQSAFFPSWTEEQDAIERKLEQSLKETLEMLPNISSAKVHVSLMSRAGATTKNNNQPSASIVIFSLHPSMVRQDELKSLVAGAYVGLSESDVHIFVYQYRPAVSGLLACNDEVANSRSTTNTWMRNECWKPCIIITVTLIMCTALIVMGVGIYRLLRNRKHRVDRKV